MQRFHNAVTALAPWGDANAGGPLPDRGGAARQQKQPNNLGIYGLGTTLPDDEASWACYEPELSHEDIAPWQPSGDERLAPAVVEG